MTQLIWALLLKKFKICHKINASKISEEEKIIRLLLLSQATNAESEGIFSVLKRVNILTALTNAGARSQE